MAKNAYIASYKTGVTLDNGKPAHGVQYVENKQALFSIPARLNGYRMPDLKDCAAILSGASIEQSEGWRAPASESTYDRAVAFLKAQEERRGKISTADKLLNAVRELTRAEAARIHAVRDLESLHPVPFSEAQREFVDGFIYCLANQTDWQDVDHCHVADLMSGLTGL